MRLSHTRLWPSVARVDCRGPIAARKQTCVTFLPEPYPIKSKHKNGVKGRGARERVCTVHVPFAHEATRCTPPSLEYKKRMTTECTDEVTAL
jgi:hypothetical protein